MTNNTRGRRGWVYFVKAGDTIKIGFSQAPRARILSMQTSHPNVLQILATVSTGIIQEHEAHAKFKHLHIRGEWFRADPEIMAFIDSLPRPSPTRDLKVMRYKYGPKSTIGRICSTLLSQMEKLPSYVAPAWATHESQTLAGKIKWQMAQLERALAAS